jgi:hypothetical protein
MPFRLTFSTPFLKPFSKPLFSLFFIFFFLFLFFYSYSHMLFFLQIYIFKSCLYIFRWIYEVYFLSVITPKYFHFYFYYEFVNVMFYIGFNHLLYFICRIVEKLWKRWIITKMVARLINDIIFLEWTKLILLGWDYSLYFGEDQHQRGERRYNFSYFLFIYLLYFFYRSYVFLYVCCKKICFCLCKSILVW